MKKTLVIAAIVLLTIGKLEAFILFTSGGNSANADHANSIDNGFGTNTFLQGFLYQFDNTTVDVSGSAGGSYDGRYYLGPSVDATFQVGIQVHGSLAYFNGGYRGSLFKALVYGYSPAQGAWAGATNAWFFVNTGFNNLDGYSTETAIPLSNFQNVLGHFVGSPTVTFSSPPVLDAGGHIFSLTLDDGRYLQNIQGSNVDTSTLSVPITTSNTFSGQLNYGQIDGVPAADNTLDFDLSYLCFGTSGGNDLIQVPVQPVNDNSDFSIWGMIFQTAAATSFANYRGQSCYGKIQGSNVVTEFTIYSTNYCSGALKPRIILAFRNATNITARILMNGGCVFTNFHAGFQTFRFTNTLNLYVWPPVGSAYAANPTGSIPSNFSITNVDWMTPGSWFDCSMASNSMWLRDIKFKFQP